MLTNDVVSFEQPGPGLQHALTRNIDSMPKYENVADAMPHCVLG